jgi:hypothetical protein
MIEIKFGKKKPPVQLLLICMKEKKKNLKEMAKY